ncbi:MAG: hypothetical protein IKX39_03040 [Muribaculaceae bacterium]|nr:hypothetical protein [Muribaculaceae bacterium]
MENNSNMVPVTENTDNWKGLTLEQLRMRRAKALLRREVGKVKLNAAFDGMKTRVSDNGIRGLMFNDKSLVQLKTADYVFLGWKIAQLFIKARRRKK